MGETKLTIETFPWDLGGDGVVETAQTILQDGGRAAVLAFLTVMSRQVSDQKLVPLTDVDSAMTPASLACSAIGGTLPEFAALSDAELGITVDGEVLVLADMDMTGIDTIEDTPGYWLCGANGDVIGNWDALTDAAFSYVIDGVAGDTGVMNFTNVITFGGLIDAINFALNGIGKMEYDFGVDKFKLISTSTGETSSVTIGSPATGTDISAAGFLNQTAGAATAGTGGEATAQSIVDIINAHALGRFTCEFNGDNFVFYSPTLGPVKSQITVLSDPSAGGTDISGSGFLNGLTGGAGTVTAATGAGGTDIPAGIFMGDDITAAALVSGDITNQHLLIRGINQGKYLDEDMIVLEGSLTLASVVVNTGKTIRQHLQAMNIFPTPSDNHQQIQPI